LPESLADMLIKQVDDFLNNKKIDFYPYWIFRLIDMKIRKNHHHHLVQNQQVLMKFTKLVDWNSHMV